MRLFHHARIVGAAALLAVLPNVPVRAQTVPTVAIVTNYDAYVPGERALISVRSNISRMPVYITVMRDGFPVWTHNGTVPKNGLRRWRYPIPAYTAPYERFRVTVSGEYGEQTVIDEREFQVVPLSPWAADCHG